MIARFISPVLAAIIVLTGVAIYNANMPVVLAMRADLVSRDSGTVVARVRGYKVRSCNVVKGTFVGWYKLNGEWHETPFAFINDTSPDSTRPAHWFSRQNFGLFQWSLVPDKAKRLRLTNTHDCDGSLRTTVSGPWTLR